MTRLRLLLAAVPVLLAGRPAAAQRFEVLGGFELGPASDYAYARVVPELTLVSPVSLVIPVTASWLWYRYSVGGETARVSAPGGSAELGLRLRAGPVVATAAGGVLVERVRREVPVFPTDGGPSTTVPTTDTGAAALLEGQLYWQISERTAALALASWTGNTRYLFGRGSVWTRVVGEDAGPVQLSLGIEGTGQGNQDVSGWGAAPLVVLAVLPWRFSVTGRLGWERQTSAGVVTQGLFGGLGLYHAGDL